MPAKLDEGAACDTISPTDSGAVGVAVVMPAGVAVVESVSAPLVPIESVTLDVCVAAWFQ